MSKTKNILLGISASLLLWGLIEPYWIDRQEHVVKIPRLPEGWQGQRVALIADLQVGMWLDNTRTIRRIVAMLVKERPAAVLIAGDFIYQPKRPALAISGVVELLRPLPRAGIPTYGVLGNHDYRMPTKEDPKDERLAAALASALESAGVRILNNEAVPLPSPRGGSKASSLFLVGIGAHIPAEDRPDLAFAKVPEGTPRLVMMHNPNTFEMLPPGAAPFAVAGHTHGGQFRIPLTPQWTWMRYTSADKVHADGWTGGHETEGNHLYVNRGIGFSVLPLRLNCPPEVTFFTLMLS
ncbi:MAG: metallophosphoesterase [Deinococcota bacterium]|nr:metallophosphoesterase [Deinococcota bacterium]